jgi:hypothetical protein
MSTGTTIKIVTPLILILAIVLLLRSCTGNVTGDLTKIAEINGPREAAAGNTDRLLGEVKAQAEGTRQAILAAGQAQLELDRAKALQDQSLAQQAAQQQAQHAADLAAINAQQAATLAGINSQTSARLAELETQKINTIAEWAIKIAFVAGGVAVVIILAITLARLAGAFSKKQQQAANIPIMLPYNKDTLTLPAFVAMVDGRPVLVDPNVGAVMQLSEPSKADTARARYLAAQNSIGVQAINAPKNERLTLPLLESEDRYE